MQCTPHRGNIIGSKIETIAKCLVEIGPQSSAFDKKHSFTSYKLPTNQFRVVSYNLLADFYSDSDYSRTKLFPYCPPSALAIDYRKKLHIRELIGYNSDLICLQEVDKKLFDWDFSICLKHNGFSGEFYKKKEVPEGLATFYNQNKFR